MELLLNAVWLVLAMGAMARCLRRLPSGRQSDWHSVVAVGCLLALLFPVVSMTDDMLAQQFAIEDPATIKVGNVHLTDANLVEQCPGPVVAAFLLVAPSDEFGSVATPLHAFLTSRAPSAEHGRAPPLSA